VWVATSETSSTASNAVAGASRRELKNVYPAGVFKVNDTKVVFITSGTSYLKVAEEHDISLARLMDFNDMRDGDVALRDGLLFLQRKRKTGDHEIHTVAPGESLYDVAQAEGIRLESLLQYNYLTPNVQPAVGEKLYLTTSAPAKPKLSSEAAKAETASFATGTTGTAVDEDSIESEALHTHIVQPKETAYSIAKKYNVGVEDLKKWNGMAATDLRIGQQIRINKARQ
jgi:LysM repeat protein